MRKLSGKDRLITRFDKFIRTGLISKTIASRRSPAEEVTDRPLTAQQRLHSASLMRVNHTGEVCAQALYLGQALVARDSAIKRSLQDASAEERDHLSWCRQRLEELDSRPSVLDPAWFAGSVAIGIGAAAIGDAMSLGFVEETEKQVCAHLDGHLAELPVGDLRSRAILLEMREDEARHAENAKSYGATSMPLVIKTLMRLQARIMTSLAYRI